ncbi:MAG: hypothetical protein ABI411_12630 [Tahibacter sp.]
MSLRIATLALLLLTGIQPVAAQLVDGTISTLPIAPTSTLITTVVVTARGCFHGGPHPFPAQVSRNGTAIAITLVEDDNYAVCFSAGDPYIPFPVEVAVGVLPAGTYSVAYTRYEGPSATPVGAPNLQSSGSFSVTGGNAAAEAPTLGTAGLLALGLLLCGAALTQRRLAARG